MKRTVDAGSVFLPKIYQDNYSIPLQGHLTGIVPRLIRSHDLTTLETVTGAVYQQNQREGQAELHRFLAVISNLYRSFLDKSKRERCQVPLRETLPPLAMFQNAAGNGPFTITVEQIDGMFGASVGVVSLPAAYREIPFLWGALAHETGGHDVTHADPGLLPELETAVQALFGAVDRTLGLLWAYWMDEAAADVYGLLNIGPTFGMSLSVFFAALIAQLEGTKGKPSLRTQSGADEFGRLDVHPTDILRLHLAIGTIKSLTALSETRKAQYINVLEGLANTLARSATSIELQGLVQLESGKEITLSNSFPLVEMQDAASRVGKLIATAKLAAIGGRSIQEIETWDDEDENKALAVATCMAQTKPVTGIGDDAQLLAGSTLAIFEDPSIFDQASTLLAGGLDESFANDPYWGQPQPDHILFRSPGGVSTKPPRYDIDPLAQELIEHDSRVVAETLGLVLGTPDPIPWPKGQAPRALKMKAAPSPNQKLPACDYLLITWTVDEANSMARLLTPGVVAVPRSGNNEPAWYHYAFEFEKLAKRIRPGAPASKNHLLGRYFKCAIGNKEALCFKSELHLGQDGPGFPLKDLFQKIIRETEAKLVITTGTAGAIGPRLKLGDVVVANHCLFHCGRTFKDVPFNGKTVTSNVTMPAAEFTLANELMAANAKHLQPQRIGVPRIYWSEEQLGQPDVIVTTDFFAFDNVENTYRLQGLGSAVEMDDAVLGLACEGLPKGGPKWLTIRNASDPEMSGPSLGQEKTHAADIYKKYGFWTTVPSVIATWASVVGINV